MRDFLMLLLLNFLPAVGCLVVFFIKDRKTAQAMSLL
jgi:hypothetical protein